MAQTTIRQVAKRSAADRAGLVPGDTLLRINGHDIHDVMDYRFYGYDRELTVLIRSSEGAERTVSIRHNEGEDLGISFPTYLMDDQRTCRNRCIFCFIDQMPKGCRSSLYIKDDDARMSFLLGNYITLTNLSDEDIDRIVAMRISPLHISVHSTNGELRARMLGNPQAERCLPILRRLTEAGLRVHTQIVLCPGYNDGAELERTLSELAELGGYVESTAIVPVGLTKHRQGLPPLEPVFPDIARETLELARQYPGVYCSDEMYLIAGEPVPEPQDDYPQLENGVGMLALFAQEWHSAEPPGSVQPQTLVTGTAAAPFLAELLAPYPVAVVPVVNRFFGDSVTVAGLVTGADILYTLQDRDLGNRVLIPSVMLKADTRLFLDGMTVDELEHDIGVPVVVVSVDGYELAEIL